VNFLLDAQLPPALAHALREAGHSAQAVREVGLQSAADAAIWAHALQTHAVIITKDEDFVLLAQQGDAGPAVIWLRLGNTSNRELRARLLPQMPQIVALIQQGNRLVEVG
jgi:predicted nuclease of predicted toxin-antitoxin system